MERIIHKAKNYQEAQKWEILQQVNMNPEERQNIAKELKKRFYKDSARDMRRKRN